MTLRPDIRLVIATLTGGGSERVCLLLANHWAAQGKLVEILLVRKEGEYLPMLSPLVHVWSANTSRALKALPGIVRRLNRWRDVPVMLFGFDFGVGLGASKRLGLLAPPIIYREGSCPERNISRKSHWRYTAFVSAADGVVAQTHAALRSLHRFGVSRGEGAVIWNPSTPGAHVGKIRHSCSQGLRLMAAGRLSPEKGFLRLIEAFATLPDKYAKSQLSIFGKGAQGEELTRKVNEMALDGLVLLRGFARDLRPHYESTDIFVLSSFYEGQPNVLLEALLAGCRVIASGGEPVREVLEALDLRECYISDGDFIPMFGQKAAEIAAMDTRRFEHACEILKSRTEISIVATTYWNACYATTEIGSEKNI